YALHIAIKPCTIVSTPCILLFTIYDIVFTLHASLDTRSTNDFTGHAVVFSRCSRVISRPRAPLARAGAFGCAAGPGAATPPLRYAPSENEARRSWTAPAGVSVLA